MRGMAARGARAGAGRAAGARWASSSPPRDWDEARIRALLESSEELRGVTSVAVQLQGGGCDGTGSLLVSLASESFDSLPLLAQHQLVKKVLAEPISRVHSVQIRTQRSKQ